MIDNLIVFYNRIVKRVSFWLPLVVLSLISYGFSAVNPTVGIDDLARDIYIGKGHAMFSATRWGMNIWVKLLSTLKFIPGIDHMIGIILMVCAALSYSFLFFTLSNNKQYSLKYTVFSCLFITYPLINEIWEYNGANFMVAGNMFIVTSVLAYMEYHKHLDWRTILVCGIPMSLVASSYETGIFVYISSVLIVVFYKYCVVGRNDKKAGWFFDGASYIPVLVLSVVIRIVVGVLIIKALGLTYKVNGVASIQMYLSDFLYNGILYIFHSLIYPPITVFLIMLIMLFVYSVLLCKKNNGVLPFVLFVLIAFSLFGQAFLTLGMMPYRTAHTLIVFVAFCGFLFTEIGEERFGKRTYLIVFCALIYLAYQQGLYLDSLLTLNHIRSENEARIATQIGYTLESQFDNKPVVFVGRYSLGEYIEDNVYIGYTKWNDKLFRQIRSIKNPSEKYKAIHTNINSNLAWSTRAFGNQEMLKAYFSYLGFDIDLVDGFNDELYNLNLEKAKEYNMKPYEIRDEGEYLLVCLGVLD